MAAGHWFSPWRPAAGPLPAGCPGEPPHGSRSPSSCSCGCRAPASPRPCGETGSGRGRPLLQHPARGALRPGQPGETSGAVPGHRPCQAAGVAANAAVLAPGTHQDSQGRVGVGRRQPCAEPGEAGAVPACLVMEPLALFTAGLRPSGIFFLIRTVLQQKTVFAYSSNGWCSWSSDQVAWVYTTLLSPPAEPGAPGSRGCHPGNEGWRRTPLPGSFLELGSDLSLRSRACGRQNSGFESTGAEPRVFVAPGTAPLPGGPCLPLPLTSPLEPGAWMLPATTSAETIPCLGFLSCADSMEHRKGHCDRCGHIRCLMSESWHHTLSLALPRRHFSAEEGLFTRADGDRTRRNGFTLTEGRFKSGIWKKYSSV